MPNSAGGSINIFCKDYSETAEEINWWATDGDLKVSSAKQIAFSSGDKVVLQDYEDLKKGNNDSNHFITGWWTDLKDVTITDAFLGQTVRFHLSTQNIANGESIMLQFFHYGMFDTRMGSLKSAIATNNGASIDFHLDKEWNEILNIQNEKDKVRFFCRATYKDDDGNELGEYLNVANKDNVLVFFIGGAGDKYQYYFTGPYHNIQNAQKHIEPKILSLPNAAFYDAHYLDYSEVYPNVSNVLLSTQVKVEPFKIPSHILDMIPNKRTPIYIVGHSLGGWNGAHLSQLLTDDDYNVQMLITLDPVGEGKWVYVGSQIWCEKPDPKAKYWINIKTVPSNPDNSDGVATFGGQWNVTFGPDINASVNVNHYNALGIFTAVLLQGKSAEDYLYESIVKKL